MNANRFSDSDNLIKYNAVLKSDSYEEYMDIANFSRIEYLKSECKDFKRKNNDAKSKKEKLSKESEKQLKKKLLWKTNLKTN